MSNLVLLLTACGLVAADQLFKLLVLRFLAGGPSVMVIPGLLQLTYVENRGAAFGIFQGRVGLLSLVTLAVLIALAVFLVRGSVRHPAGRWSFCLILARYGYVHGDQRRTAFPYFTVDNIVVVGGFIEIRYQAYFFTQMDFIVVQKLADIFNDRI